MCSSTGIFGIFYTAFGWLLKVCCNLTGGYYIFAIILFSVIMQVVLFPFGIKRQKTTVKQAQLRPKEMLIREKYKGRTDRVTQQKMNMEIQELYQREGYSPFSGCLPLLIQLPIIIILWSVIRMPLTYATTPKVNVKDQHETAYNIVDGGIKAIDESKLILSDADAAEASEEAKKFSDNLSSLKKSLESLRSRYGAYDDAKNFVKNESFELEVTKFIINDERAAIKTNLKNNGVSDEIINKNITEEMIFSPDVEKSLPKFTFLGINLLYTPSEKGFSLMLIIPLLVFLSSVWQFYVTKKLNPQPAGADNGMGGGFLMKWGLPLFSAYLSFATFPVAIGVYWIVRTCLSVAENYILAKMYPIPVVTEEELAEIKRQIKSRKKKVITIEVDEDDDSYDHLAVKKEELKDEPNDDMKTDTPKNSSYEMLSGDDSDIETKVDWVDKSDKK